MRRRVDALMAALVIGIGLGGLAWAGPAAAGGWAATVIDPLPSRIEAGQAYEVSFWVLQHGTHPYHGDQPDSIGSVGLALVDARGTSVSFPGRALAEPAHYTATVTVPHDGSWRVTGVQGVFADFHVGTLTVPGSLEALGVPAAPSPADLQKYWPGSVRPPVLPIDQKRDPFAPQPLPVTDQAAAETAATPAAGAEPASTPTVQRGVRAWLVAVAVGGLVLVLAVGVGGHRWWIRRGRSASESAV
ncbi:MAG TPA: hypothetical protein VFX61_01760 [Micromonosporaceae bacterium]|nr:hypothetical protein [Micromonosporaceae bacterium]